MEVNLKDIEAHQYVLFSLSILQSQINNVLYDQPVIDNEQVVEFAQIYYWMQELNGQVDRLNEAAGKLDGCIRHSVEYLDELNNMETVIVELTRLHSEIVAFPCSSCDEDGLTILRKLSEHILYQIDSFIDRYGEFVEQIEKKGKKSRLGSAKQSALLVFQITAPTQFKSMLNWLKKQTKMRDGYYVTQ